jgi:hypothetical protein
MQTPWDVHAIAPVWRLDGEPRRSGRETAPLLKVASPGSRGRGAERDLKCRGGYSCAYPDCAVTSLGA